MAEHEALVQRMSSNNDKELLSLRREFKARENDLNLKVMGLESSLHESSR
jgi:hypothetical protein